MRDNNKKKYLIISIIVGLFVFIMCNVFFFAKRNLSKTDNEVLEKEETQIEEQIDEPEEENKYITNVDPSELKNKEEVVEDDATSDEPVYVNELGEPLPDLSDKELEKISLVYEETEDFYIPYLEEFQTEHEIAFKKYISEYLEGNNLNMNVTEVPKCTITISEFTAAMGTNVFHCFIELDDETAKEMDVILFKEDKKFALTIVNRDVGRTNGMIRAE